MQRLDIRSSCSTDTFDQQVSWLSEVGTITPASALTPLATALPSPGVGLGLARGWLSDRPRGPGLAPGRGPGRTPLTLCPRSPLTVSPRGFPTPLVLGLP